MDTVNTHIPIKFLSSHSSWLSMDWEVRGMATQIMALGDFEKYKGTIPPEDELWRSCLGIPSNSVLRMAIKKMGKDDKNTTFEIVEAWDNVWKPQLLNWFILIDDDFIDKRSDFSHCKGRYWHPLLDIWLEQAKNTPAKKRARKKKAASDESVDKTSTSKKVAKKSASKKVSKKADPHWDYPIIIYSDNVLRHNWETPISKEARSDLWQNATELLAIPGDAKSNATARQFLGKQIKEFGEKNVAAAVAQLMVRPVKPADPKSFLRKQLKIMTEGSEKVQRARQQRIKVSL